MRYAQIHLTLNDRNKTVVLDAIYKIEGGLVFITSNECEYIYNMQDVYEIRCLSGRSTVKEEVQRRIPNWQSNKILAIKAVREILGIGLREAKEMVDSWL